MIEIMIAIAVLAITLVTVFRSQSQSISMQTRARIMTSLSLLANAKMAQIEALSPESLVSGKGDFGSDFPDYTWQVNITDSPGSLKRIELTVRNTRLTGDNVYRLVLYKFYSAVNGS